ncbi:MAG: GNAT family N-acetyltransferase [Deltaproteobacteria bacterium]|jgi:ribosomal protein S18 acetylase RimI-like enzyme|nr:GNAT family N-acetyltransferase [Deltaproteobacteria bacterium]
MGERGDRTKARNEATARIMAATLTLITREQTALAEPYSLWNPTLKAWEIRQMAHEVADSKAQVLWVEESHPALGLMAMKKRELESSLLGYGSAMLKGPFLVDPDPASRQKKTLSLALKARELARKNSFKFLTAKTTHDPAVLRGFMEANFSLAEIITCLAGPIAEMKKKETSKKKLLGLSIEVPDPQEAQAILEELGDLFYDGHHLHGPYLSGDFSGRLWSKVAERDLKNNNPALVVRDIRQNRSIGIAIAYLVGQEAMLSILHVDESRRGKGIGGELLRELMILLYEKGAISLSAETASWNLPALSLYISLGLRPISPLVALHSMEGAKR